MLLFSTSIYLFFRFCFSLSRAFKSWIYKYFYRSYFYCCSPSVWFLFYNPELIKIGSKNSQKPSNQSFFLKRMRARDHKDKWNGNKIPLCCCCYQQPLVRRYIRKEKGQCCFDLYYSYFHIRSCQDGMKLIKSNPKVTTIYDLIFLSQKK